MRLTALDVGQGLAAVVETRSHVLVFDAGPSYRSGADAGQLVVVPYLESRGIRRIDALVASHDDDDHKGGASSVLEALDVEQTIVGPSVRSLGPGAERTGPWARCRAGAHWAWDGVAFEWLHPGAGPYERDNDSSCVLRVTAGEHRFLLTGDIEAVAEAEVLKTARLGSVEIVVAPHHGSRTSSSPAFVAATRPRWVIFSVGYRNRWGFPAPPVVARWERSGAHTLRTSASGAVEFVAQPGKPLPDPGQWRIDRRRLWADP